jgi:hypothetical protein
MLRGSHGAIGSVVTEAGDKLDGTLLASFYTIRLSIWILALLLRATSATTGST